MEGHPGLVISAPPRARRASLRIVMVVVSWALAVRSPSAAGGEPEEATAGSPSGSRTPAAGPG